MTRIFIFIYGVFSYAVGLGTLIWFRGLIQDFPWFIP